MPASLLKSNQILSDYNLNPLLFCSVFTELRRFCCNFSHCFLNHCTIDCRFIVSSNLYSPVKSSSILQTASFILNDCPYTIHIVCQSVLYRIEELSFYVYRFSYFFLVEFSGSFLFSVSGIRIQISWKCCKALANPSFWMGSVT